MTDLTPVLDAAARARWDQTRQVHPSLPEWDELPPVQQHRLLEDLLPAVTAAVTALEVQLKAEREDLSWRREFVGIVEGLDLDIPPEARP